MSRGQWKRPLKNTRGRSTGKGQLPTECPKLGKGLERARHLPRLLDACKGQSLLAQPNEAPLHPLAHTIQEQVVIPKISEILFQIDSRSASNCSKEKPLGFEGKFLDRVHREWEFSSYAETLNQLLSKQIRILEKDHIVVDDAVRKYFFTLCTEKGYRYFLTRFNYCVEITKFQKLSSLHIYN